jgi:predicted RNA-binding protein with PIN domain
VAEAAATRADEPGRSPQPHLAELPEPLLVPLLDAAVDVLRELEPEHVPHALRPMISWDRRGLARSAARLQLLRAYADDDGFRSAVEERFLRRPEVAVLVDRFDHEPLARSLGAVLHDAAGRGDEGLVASTLVAHRPPGWEYAIGVVVGHHLRDRSERAEQDDRAAAATRLRTVEEALRRTEAARDEARAALERLDGELRAERRARRAKEEDGEVRAELDRRRASELERAVESERARADAAEERAGVADERGRRDEAVVAELRRERDDLAARLEATSTALHRSAAPGSGLRYQDLQVLWESAAAAEGLAAALAALAHRVQDAAAEAGVALASTHALRDPQRAPLDDAPEARSTPAGDRAAGSADRDDPTAPVRRPEPGGTGSAGRRRRAPVPTPPGMVAETAEAVAGAMSGGHKLAVVVDGYNVAMRAWPGEPASTQRERLGALVGQWQLRTRQSVTVVFDGADVAAPMGTTRRNGVRTVFSGPREEADDVIVREVGAVPLDQPVIVASSDRDLQRRVGAEGALAVDAQVLLDLVRR